MFNKLFTVILFLAVSSVAMASPQNEFGFKFNFQSKVLELKVKANTHKEAYEIAAQECFNYYTGVRNRDKASIEETKGLAIIDSCANPRSI